MKRKDFIKLSGLTAFGVSSGIFTPTLFARTTKEEKLIMPENLTKKIILDLDDEMWFGWLARLVVSSLVMAMGAKIVEKFTDNCVCDETTCYKSPSDYSNAIGIYGYNSNSNRFVRQTVNDRRVNFDNVSVPFLTKHNSRIGNVEGPFLAGICWAAESLGNSYSAEMVKRVIVPTKMYRNGGYRFDTDACYPTKYESEYGTTEIQYLNRGYGRGIVTVKARDKYDNLDWNESYDFNYF